LAITPDGAFAYVAQAGYNVVNVISIATNTRVATIPVGTYPVFVAFTPGNTRVFGTTLQTSSSYAFTVEQGTQATEYIQLVNPGGMSHSATFDLFNPSTDPSVSLVGPNSIDIEPGETKSIPINIDASAAPVGTYNNILLQVTADDGGTLVVNVTVYVVPPDTPPLPDLAISTKDIGFTTNADGSVNLTADVHNQGAAPAANIQVAFYDFDSLVGTTTLSQVVVGGHGITTVTLPMPASGDHMIRVVVDPADAIPEVTKSNNEATRIITISASGPETGGILVRGDLPAAVCPGLTFTVSGQAVYDITVNGVSNTDYPVKGAPVEITTDGSTEYGDMHTDSSGDFVRPLIAPTSPGFYPVTMTVTDTTLSGTGNFVVDVLEPDACQQTQQSPEPIPVCTLLVCRSGGPGPWIFEYSDGSWKAVCTASTCPPIPDQDVFVYSEDIAFLPNHPDASSDVTIGAQIQYEASSSALPSGQVEVDIYVAVPGAPKTEISKQVLDNIPPGGSSSVFANWPAQADGIYIVEVDAIPLQLVENTQDNDATRTIIVGPYTSGQGVIDGQVSNMTGGVGGVLIKVSNANGTIASTATDDTGFYLFQNVPVGDYQVTAATQTQTASVTDQSVTNVDFVLTQPTDTTPPVITPTVSGTLGNNGWYVGNATVSWLVVDNESSISSKSGCDTTTVTTDTTGVTFICSATSSGGTASQSVTVKRDASPPTITGSATPAANGSGWNNTLVTVSFTCNDATSGVLSCAAPQVLDEGANQSVSGAATDKAGNTATTQVIGINVDLTPPLVNVTGVTGGAVYTLGTVPAAGCTTTDALSGVQTNATLSVTGGNGGGTGTFTASCSGALDKAGNLGAASVTYQVKTPVQISWSNTGALYSRVTKLFTSTLTLTNNGPALVGTIDVVLNGLPAGVTLTNATGQYNGAPEIQATSTGLAAGASLNITLKFSNPNNTVINYTPQALVVGGEG
jgi:YVTN family beta-propeller protein